MCATAAPNATKESFIEVAAEEMRPGGNVPAQSRLQVLWPALQRLGEMVHVLDVGGEPTAEASGFEAVLAGARARIEDDDSLLAEMGNVLDSLYAHFQNFKARG